MVYEMVPVVDELTLRAELEFQFGKDILDDETFLADILFDNEYNNNPCKYYNFEKDEVYEGKFWQDEECIRICNCVNAILRDKFPNHKKILIDVSW